MKLGTILKKIIIFLILLICIVTVLPIVLMLCDVSDNGFRSSALGELIDELEG